jgi:hypothetical protein
MDKPLFDAMQRLARKLKLSLGRLNSLVRYPDENRRLLALLNEAHAEGPDADETKVLEASLREHRSLTKGEW